MTIIYKSLYTIVLQICTKRTLQKKIVLQKKQICLISIKGSGFKPISCMFNLYKLTTKYVTKVMQFKIKQRGLLEKNQMRTWRRV